MLLHDYTIALGEDDELVSRDIKLLDRLANDLLRNSVRVDIGSIPRVETTIVSSLEQWESLIGQLGKCNLDITNTWNKRTLSSSITQL